MATCLASSSDFFGMALLNSFRLGQIFGVNGMGCFLSEDQYAAWRIKHGPKPSRIQFFLKQAASYRQRLGNTPGLTQSTLAKDIGLSRYELIHNLNLLKLEGGQKQQFNELGASVTQ